MKAEPVRSKHSASSFIIG